MHQSLNSNEEDYICVLIGNRLRGNELFAPFNWHGRASE